jgi:hypothetical protein
MKNQSIASMLLPRSLRTGSVLRDGLGIMSHLFKDYGWVKSQKAGRCLDAQGQPIPWFTYPAIDFIKQLDLRELRVFEYGSGASTLFWSMRTKEIISTESDKEWFEEIAASSTPNMKVILASNGVESYVSKIVEHGMFDIIVIDGTGDSRLACSQLAPKHLKPGGFVILDNSDLWLNSAAALRNADLIQVDFTGLTPLSRHWSTTSIFLSRQYSIQPLDGYQPHKSVAQPAAPWPGA